MAAPRRELMRRAVTSASVTDSSLYVTQCVVVNHTAAGSRRLDRIGDFGKYDLPKNFGEGGGALQSTWLLFRVGHHLNVL